MVVVETVGGAVASPHGELPVHRHSPKHLGYVSSQNPQNDLRCRNPYYPHFIRTEKQEVKSFAPNHAAL